MVTHARLIAGLSVPLAVAAAAGFRLIRSPSSARPAVVRIGINNSPPYSILRPDGSYSGFTIDVLNEAARRRGIVLQWVVAPEGPDVALRQGKVDVWHLLTDLPERRQWAYFTDPWLRTQFVLAVRENSGIRTTADARGRRIAHLDVALQSRHARTLFPGSFFLPEPADTQLNAVCLGKADAAFIDLKHLVPRLLHRTVECEAFPLDTIPVEHASYQMAIGATRNGFRAASELRREITRMDLDLTLEALCQKWLRDTSDETGIISELVETQRRSNLFRYGAAILALLVAALVLLIHRDRAVRRAVKSALEFASSALDGSGGLVFISDRHGRIVRLNRECRMVTGKTVEQVRNKSIWEAFVPPEERNEVQNLFARLAGGLPYANHEHHWETRDGPRLFSWSITVLLNKAGRVEYIIATGIDISNREAVAKQLGYEATHDPLTNLVNRRGMLRELDAMAASAQASGPGFSIALADLDRFKAINDTYGHDAGDEVLRVLARLLHTELGSGDLGSRLGGDEFCILLRSKNFEPVLERIAGRLREHEFCSPAGIRFHASVSFGVATWSEDCRQSEDLLRAADRSLYLSKARSRPEVREPTIA